MTFTDWGIGGKSTYFKIELVLDLTYTTIRLLLQPFLWLYTPEIHSKTALLNEWMDNGNKTFHLFLIIHDQTTNYVFLTKALYMHNVFSSRVLVRRSSLHNNFSHWLSIKYKTYSLELSLFLVALTVWTLYIFFNFVFRILRRHQQHTKLRHL